MKKTAMQQLIEQLESMKPQSQIVDFIKDQATELLKTEREQIEEAASYGYYESPSEELRKEFGEQYYKETYG